MSCAVTTGRTEPCKDNVGGIRNVYLATFSVYSNTQILGVPGSEITYFPPTTFYKFEVNSADFQEQSTNDSEGIFWDQTLTVTMTGFGGNPGKEYVVMNPLTKVDVRYIIEYNNGNFRMGGTRNGARLTSFVKRSGGAKSDFLGYELEFKAKERYFAEHLANLQVPSIVAGELILQEDLFNLLQEDSSNILQEY